MAVSAIQAPEPLAVQQYSTDSIEPRYNASMEVSAVQNLETLRIHVSRSTKSPKYCEYTEYLEVFSLGEILYFIPQVLEASETFLFSRSLGSSAQRY